jgi:hypothetical protein
VVMDEAFLTSPNAMRAIVDLATAQRFPSIGFLELAEAGGLMSYGLFFPISIKTRRFSCIKLSRARNPSSYRRPSSNS